MGFLGPVLGGLSPRCLWVQRSILKRYLDQLMVNWFGLKLTFSHLKMDGWNSSFLLGWPIFRGKLLLVLGRVLVSISINGKLVVWGPVVWIPGIPENERDCYLRVPLKSQTTGPQANN